MKEEYETALILNYEDHVTKLINFGVSLCHRLLERRTTHWVTLLPFVQLKKNTAYHQVRPAPLGWGAPGSRLRRARVRAPSRFRLNMAAARLLIELDNSEYLFYHINDPQISCY